jgi:hypothetical protein
LSSDKASSKATLEHKSLPWERDPVECPLSSISGARVSASIDAESQAEICSVALAKLEGDGWVLLADDKQHAMEAVTAVREFLGIEE